MARISLAACCLATAVRSQPPTAALTVGQLISKFRSGEDGGLVTRRLMQPAGTVPPKELDAIADSLVTIALGGPSGATGAETRHSAASALRAAALGLGARASEVPYRGGLDRLSRIAIDGKDEMVRIVAMLGLSRLPDSARVVSVFRALAMKQDVLAVDAVDLLWKSMGPAGLQALRELDRDALVTEPEARRELSFIARKFGWR